MINVVNVGKELSNVKELADLRILVESRKMENNGSFKVVITVTSICCSLSKLWKNSFECTFEVSFSSKTCLVSLSFVASHFCLSMQYSLCSQQV